MKFINWERKGNFKKNLNGLPFRIILSLAGEGGNLPACPNSLR